MVRWIAALLGFVVLLGCHGTQPVNINPLAPYGPSLIPPPPTGRAGQADPYYRRSQAGTSSAVGATSQFPPPDALSRFTSDQSGIAVADHRAGIADGASVSPMAGSDSGLGWGGGGNSVASLPVPSSPQPRPQFPSPPAGSELATRTIPPTLDPRVTQAAAQLPAAQLPVAPASSGWVSPVGSGVARQPTYNGWTGQ